MPAIKCPLCDYRNIGSGNVCANCGEELYDTTDGHDSSDSAWQQEEHRESRALIPHAGRSLVKNSVPGGPYRMHRPIQQYDYQTFIQPLVRPEKSLGEDIDWESIPIWRLPRRTPHLRGTIIHIQSELQFPDYPNLLRALLDIMAEMIWIAANQPLHREGERIQVTILRVRTREGEIRDARLPGYLRGAHLSLGDAISLWGWRRRGSLTVRRGYNHTSKAIITSNMMSMLLPALIVLCLIGLTAFVVSFWPSLVDAWSVFFPRK